MTFADKLKKFKTEHVGFKVETEEIAKGLCKVFQMEHMGLPNDVGEIAWRAYGSTGDLYMAQSGYGTTRVNHRGYREFLPITSQELQRYLKIRKGIQENPEVYFPTPTREIYDELMNTLDSLGCRWASGDKPMEYDEFNSDTVIIVRNKRVTWGCSTVSVRVIISLTSEPPTPSQTITIVSDGHHKVTAESNGITAEATCCPTDTFSITKGTHMALQRLLEKQKEADVIQELGDLTDEEHKFHKGDVVEVIERPTGGPEGLVGLQGVIQEYSYTIPSVKFQITIGGSDTWAFIEERLKLIRRNPCK